jgi:hypothetical protein
MVICTRFSYCSQLPKIGGLGKYIEFDETCLVMQKHHHGTPKKVTQQWYTEGTLRSVQEIVEEDDEG